MMSSQTLASRILALLPQTQCGQCAYADCAAYAQAIAEDAAAINRCPTGGQSGIIKLAELLNQPVISLDIHYGHEKPRAIARIDPETCTGCARCIPICPVDAIAGARKRFHKILDPYCTGCGLCVPACPLDCIQMHAVSGNLTGWDAWTTEQAQEAAARYQRHQARRLRETDTENTRLQMHAVRHEDTSPSPDISDKLKNILARARAKNTDAPTER